MPIHPMPTDPIPTDRTTVDVRAAERFIAANARLIDRHRVAVLLHGADNEPVLAALRAYRNTDGGFGHALEPDVRSPYSEPAATLHALEVLAGIDGLDNPMVVGAADWVSAISNPDGGLPFVMPTADSFPHGPWMVPSDGGSHLTFAIAACLWRAGSKPAWLAKGTDWCWATLARPEGINAWLLKFALDFLDAVPDETRARSAVETLRSQIGADGTVPVPGGTEDERLTPLTLSPSPGARSRAMFTTKQIETDLDLLEAGQQPDGGWTFDWLGWSPGQSVEWRGIVTLRALETLVTHGRLTPQAVD